MRKVFASAVGALALVCTCPAAAQDDPAKEDVFGALTSMFAPPALTAEEEARLPAARSVVEKILPPGTMGEMMGAMFDRFLGPLADLAAEPSSAEAAKQLGLESGEIELDSEQSAEILTLLDPVWRERQERTMAATKSAVGKMMTAMEPAMREAMTQLYAINFSDAELADIGAFFSTPSGATFARKFFTLASDPRMAGVMLQSMPEMMGSFAEMEADMAAAVADLPPVRTYADLDVAQRQRLAELTGLDQASIEAGMARAAAGEDGEGFEEYEDYDDHEESDENDSY